MIRLEELEQRIVLSYVVADQTLFWTGTQGPDAVVFESVDPTTVRVRELAIDGAPSELEYLVANVLRLSVVARGSDDLIDASLLNAPTTLTGGMGADTILGGSQVDLIHGDADSDPHSDGAEGESDFIHSGDGNDIIYADGPEGGELASDTVIGGAGDDVIYGDGAEGAADVLDGGDGDDVLHGGEGDNSLVGGAGDDLLMGAAGAELLQGGDGSDILIGQSAIDTLEGAGGRDLLVGGVLLVDQIPAIVSAWQVGDFLSDKVAGVLIAGGFVGDEAVDVLDGGGDFNLRFDETLPDYSYGSLSTGATYVVNTPAALGNALAVATHGDRVLIEPGVYDLAMQITRTWNNVSVMGLGNAPSDVVLRGVHFNVTSTTDPFLLANLMSDLTGEAALPSGGAHVFRGKTVLDRVEISGISLSQTPALYFATFMQQQDVTSEVIVMNSYVHNVAGDAISTGGYGSSPEVLANSAVMLFGTRGHTSGPNDNHQVLTAHSGYRLIDIGGHYWDAVRSVIAPDNATSRIDLYFTVVEAGARSAGIELPSMETLVHGATFLQQDRIEIHGQIRYSRVESTATKASGAMIVAFDDAILWDNTFVYHNPGLVSWALRVVGDNVQVVDNVFENWDDGFEIDDAGEGTLIDGNVFL